MMRQGLLFAAVVALSLACGSGALRPSGFGDEPPPPPKLGPIGSFATLDVGAWNLKNFPCGNASNSTVCRPTEADTPLLVAQLIRTLQPDLLAVEEIADDHAFNTVVQNVPDRKGILSTQTYFDGTYQKVGFIYDDTVLEATSDATLLFDSDPAFPRPPLMVSFNWHGPGPGLSFTAIGVHLKAGGTADDLARRKTAIAELAAKAQALVDGGNGDVVILGDFNQTFTEGGDNFIPFEDAKQFDIRTEALAKSGQVTFLPSGSMIDHIVTTTGFQAVGKDPAIVPPLDEEVPAYLDRVSDHLPVFLSLSHP
jgi:endonuclease/exonuclease/phosphatase family metal-dependent hydrolase